jgi:hypothetical protein
VLRYVDDRPHYAHGQIVESGRADTYLLGGLGHFHVDTVLSKPNGSGQPVRASRDDDGPGAHVVEPRKAAPDNDCLHSPNPTAEDVLPAQAERRCASGRTIMS